MSAGEFEEWKQFYEIRPFGDEWQDFRDGFQTAHIVSSMASIPDGMMFHKFIETCMPLIAGRNNKWRGRMTPEEQVAMLESMRR